MGRMGMTRRSEILLIIAAAMIVTGVGLLTFSPAWAVLTIGIQLGLYALLRDNDPPKPPPPGTPPGVTRVGR